MLLCSPLPPTQGPSVPRAQVCTRSAARGSAWRGPCRCWRLPRASLAGLVGEALLPTACSESVPCSSVCAVSSAETTPALVGLPLVQRPSQSPWASWLLQQSRGALRAGSWAQGPIPLGPIPPTDVASRQLSDVGLSTGPGPAQGLVHLSPHRSLHGSLKSAWQLGPGSGWL